MIGIYVHIPFCARRCDYCDFFVQVGRDGEGRFFEQLARDLTESAARLPAAARRADTIYFGGGTPSYVEPGRIASVIRLCGELFELTPGIEISLEANPESVEPARSSAWLEAGVNRLSLGVQSFADDVLRPRGRLHDAAQAADASRAARSAGFRNLGIDLIAGLPGETPDSFARGIDSLIELQPDHVSVYLLETAESGKHTSLSRSLADGRERAPGEEAVIAMYEGGVRQLGQAGFEQYEISNFARPARRSRHNLKYWTGAEYLGVGPSAHSLLDGRRIARPAGLAEWVDWMDRARTEPAAGDLTLPGRDERAREALILALRLLEGVQLDAFAARWGYDPRRTRAAEIQSLIAAGLLGLSGACLRLTPRGLLLSNEVFVRLS
ncbi:MAG TPA: radical SAM family heme chaperone HemW [Candidatus Polarisedimenticolia bacterium]|nr:radical SAM family heme chaperone HemW [Candidatus Polarisedimenticolia bacterium]